MKFHPDETSKERPSLFAVILGTFILALVLFGMAWELFGFGPVPTDTGASLPLPPSQPRIGGSMQDFVNRYGPPLQLVENDLASPYAFNDGEIDLTVTLTGRTVRELSAYSPGWTPRDAQRYCLRFLPTGSKVAGVDSSTLYTSSVGHITLTISNVQCNLDSID